MDIGEKEFMRMSVKQQNLVLFQNTNRIIRERVKDKFQLKVLSVVVSILTAAIIYIGKLLLEHMSNNGG